MSAMAKEKTEALNLSRVLFVDDEASILRAITRLFMDEDIEVLTATSGEEALKILRDNSDIAVIVSDQRMPGMTGVEFLERAKEIAPDAIRMVLTGYADINASIDSINRCGVSRYISKPWKDDELVHIVREAVERYNLINENRRLNAIVEQQKDELKKWNSELQLYVQEQTIEIQRKNEELQRLHESVKKGFMDIITTFSEFLELRNNSTGKHSRNVADISEGIAREIGLSDEEIETIRRAALLHDIGKLGIPDILLIKDPKDMDKDERAIYERHPVMGQAAIDPVVEMREVGLLIRYHHECYNGKGFPDRLSGDEIPLASNIIGMADFIDREVRKVKGGNLADTVIKKVVEEIGERFDLRLYQYIEIPVREFCSKSVSTGDAVEVELPISDLQAGMVLSRDVRSGTGLLLLGKGIKLDRDKIEVLQRYYELDPSETGVFVYAKG